MSDSEDKAEAESKKHPRLRDLGNGHSMNLTTLASSHFSCTVLTRNPFPEGIAVSDMCHRYDFLVHLWNRLNFFELFKLYFLLGLIMTPHVFHDHMIYVYSFFHVSFFTRSHGQEKSSSYYDLFNFRVLFYGHTPTFIFLFLLYYPTPILTIKILIIWADLEKSVQRPRCMEKREILRVQWRTMFSPN